MVPISITSFRSHVEEMHSERDRRFEAEYQVCINLPTMMTECKVYDVCLFTLVSGIGTHSCSWCGQATIQPTKEPICKHLPMYGYVVWLLHCSCLSIIYFCCFRWLFSSETAVNPTRGRLRLYQCLLHAGTYMHMSVFKIELANNMTLLSLVHN